MSKRATPENRLAQDMLLATRHLVCWFRNNTGVADYAGVKVRYGLGGVPGSADWIGILLSGPNRGRFVAVELKVRPRKPTPEQLQFLRRVRRAGGLGAVCYSVEDVMQLIGSVPVRKVA